MDPLPLNSDSIYGCSLGITMDDYEKAYPLFGFDLSNSGESFDPEVLTAPRVGYYRLSTLFSKPCPTNITAIYFFILRKMTGAKIYGHTFTQNF